MKKKATNKIVIKYSMKEYTESREVILCNKTNTKTKGKGFGKGKKKESLKQTKANEEPLTSIIKSYTTQNLQYQMQSIRISFHYVRKALYLKDFTMNTDSCLHIQVLKID